MATELSIPMDLLRLSLLFFSYLIKVITCSYFDVNYLRIYYINMPFNMIGNNNLRNRKANDRFSFILWITELNGYFKVIL